MPQTQKRWHYGSASLTKQKKKKVPIDLAIQIDAAIGYKGVVT